MSFRDDKASDRGWVRWGVISGVVGAIVAVITLIVGLAGSNGDSPKDNSTAGIPYGRGAITQPPDNTTAASQPTEEDTPASQPTDENTPLAPAPSPQRVPLFLLCQGSNDTDFCEQGTRPLESQVFSYDMEAPIDHDTEALGEWIWILNVPANTCSKLVLQFAPSAGLSGNTSVSARVLQGGPASAIISAATDHIGTLTAKLNGSPFYLEFKSTVTKGPVVFVSGYAVCTTDTGLPE